MSLIKTQKEYTTMTAAIYVRTSHEQDDNYSLAAQLNDITQYCARNNITVDAKYLFQETYSGYTWQDRTQLQKLLTLVQQGKVTDVIIWRVDRLSRRKHHAQWILGEYFHAHHVNLHVTDRNVIVSDSFADSVLFDLDANRAQEERSDILKRTQRGRVQKVVEGVWLGQGSTVYGYEKHGAKKTTQLSINNDEAKVVELIYKLYAEERTPMIDIARFLDAQGILSPSQLRDRRIKARWNRESVRQILRDSRYTGTFYAMRHKTISKGKRIRVPVEEQAKYNFPDLRIVDDTLWNTAQHLLDTDSNRRAFSLKYPYLMNKRLTCICGNPLVPHSRKEYAYGTGLFYRCKGRIMKQDCIIINAFPSSVIDNAVWDSIESFLRNPVFTLETLRAIQQEQKHDNQDAVNQITIYQEKQKEYDAKLKQMYADYLDELIDKETYKHYKALYTDRLNAAKEAAEQWNAKVSQQVLSDKDIKRVIKQCNNLADMLDRYGSLEYEQKKHIIDMLNVHAKLVDDTGSYALKIYIFGMLLDTSDVMQRTLYKCMHPMTDLHNACVVLTAVL